MGDVWSSGIIVALGEQLEYFKMCFKYDRSQV